MLTRIIALVITGIGLAIGNYNGSIDFVRGYADWQWFVSLYIMIPIAIIICMVMTGILTGIGNTHSKGVGAIVGVGAIILSGLLIATTSLQLLESYFLFEAIRGITEWSQINMEYLYLFMGVFVLNTLMGMFRTFSSKTTTS